MARRGYTYNDRQRTAPNTGAATAAVLVPLALIAGGILLWKRSTTTVAVGHDSNALPGMSGFGSSFKKAVKKATSSVQKVTDNKVLRPVLAVATAGGSELTKKSIDLKVDPKGTLKKLDPVNTLSKLPGASKSPLIRRLRPRGSSQPNTQPEPGQQIVYQDVNGTVITQAEYNAIMQAMTLGQPIQLGYNWAMPAGYIITAAQYAASFPGTSGSQTVVSDPYGAGSSSGASSGGSSGGGGGGGGASYDLGPEAPAVQQYAPATADAPAVAAADKKFNPLLAVGALIAVPVVMGLTGGK